MDIDLNAKIINIRDGIFMIEHIKMIKLISEFYINLVNQLYL